MKTGNPIPEIEWSKDGVPLTSTPPISFGCDGQRLSLEIKPCGLEHAGTYACKIKNPLGRIYFYFREIVFSYNQFDHNFQIKY